MQSVNLPSGGRKVHGILKSSELNRHLRSSLGPPFCLAPEERGSNKGREMDDEPLNHWPEFSYPNQAGKVSYYNRGRLNLDRTPPLFI